MTNQEAGGEHSSEPLTPTSIVTLLEDDDGTHTRRCGHSETTERVEENEQRCREQRASLVEVRENEYDHQMERYNLAAP